MGGRGSPGREEVVNRAVFHLPWAAGEMGGELRERVMETAVQFVIMYAMMSMSC